MSSFSINTTYPVDVTLLPNVFLDTYMPSANGEFVKIYLYLLRMAGRNADFSLAAVADALSCTEADVRRALRYWERTGLLLISGDPSGEMDGISLCMPEEESSKEAPVRTDKEKPPAAAKGSGTPRSTITAKRIDELRESEEIQELLFIAQQYIGHPLNRTELEKILYFYDDLHFSAELIDYLIEYCSNSGHNSIHYIEKVALSWHDEGIRTVEAARQQAKSYNKDYYAIFRALGINNHSPIPAEIRIMDKWPQSPHSPMRTEFSRAGIIKARRHSRISQRSTPSTIRPAKSQKRRTRHRMSPGRAVFTISSREITIMIRWRSSFFRSEAGTDPSRTDL